MSYQPKTGQRCTCKQGQHRDNCPTCEGTGWVIDFRAIHARKIGDTMSKDVLVKMIPNTSGTPQGKLADAELHFVDGILVGLKLIGFAVWERRTGGGKNVTFPARQYSVNGERRSFALLRPITDVAAQDQVRDLIIAAYDDLFPAQ